jgi:outer membrane scaffolding protein for murein synthesis (MipA/OmpV family)
MSEFGESHIERRAHRELAMIDPVEFGEMRGAFTSLQGQVKEIRARQAKIDEKLDEILGSLSEAKGGWRMMMLLGGAASTVGAGVSWIVAHWKS